MDCSSDVRIDRRRLLQPRIEAEVAFTLCADISTTLADDAPGYVDRVYAALKIVDSRVAGWDIRLSDTVADNASFGLYVLGQSRPERDSPDLAAVSKTMTRGDVVVSAAVGSDCLGSPWEALAWLANTTLSFGSRCGPVR